MVGRLIKHEQIRLHHEELGEVGAHHPAARVFTGGFGKIVLLETETRENFFGLRFELVAVERGELILRLCELGCAKVSGSLTLTDRPQQADHFRGDAHRNFKDRLIRWFARFLRKVAGDRVFVAVNGAFVGLVFVEDHTEKGGFPRAVWSYEGDTFAPVD